MSNEKQELEEKTENFEIKISELEKDLKVALVRATKAESARDTYKSKQQEQVERIRQLEQLLNGR